MAAPEASLLCPHDDPAAMRPVRDSADSVSSDGGRSHPSPRPSGPPGDGAAPGCPAIGIPVHGMALTNGAYRSGLRRYHTRRTRRPGPEGWLEEIQRNYRANLRPALVQLRLSRIFSGLKISADALLPAESTPHLALTMSAAKKTNKYVKKIVVAPALGRLQAFTPSMEIGWLRLQFAVMYDWKNGRWDLSYRAKTKWSKGSKIAHKFQHMNSEKLSLSSDWSLRQEFPQVGGSMGGHHQPKMEPDIGKFQLDFSRLKVSCHM
ncbi:unnamed protein product [Ostreobium quekettii]|uniref:DUF7781 domain-containing protein n=1 Tax=Ostreobium quekettii TaxID=121088 RepID=A0A8S1ILY2_9CHLO|nr:unnamed protein product [Ostreobium quekettii]|eukprot:evm.model.scf_503.2 EVM.evm.TU.scf_503.2   scf_503:11445-14561(-)